MSKERNQQLRAIVGRAYAKELERELHVLEEEFRRWRSKEIDAFELEALIHRFHNGPARKLWSTYANASASMLTFNAAGAVARGVIPREEVPAEVLQELESAIAGYRRIVDDTGSTECDEVG
jgi:hypothetical protein